MKKTLLIAGALLLASASSAFAQGYNPYYGGRAYYGRQNAYTDYFRQLRACQRHERLHEELDAAHAEEHSQGLESRADHRDLHDALEDAHDAYHDDHPRADNCDEHTSELQSQSNLVCRLLLEKKKKNNIHLFLIKKKKNKNNKNNTQ